MRNFSKYIFIYLALVYGLTLASSGLLPLSYQDMQMFLPAIVAFICILLERKKILPLFKLGSVTDMGIGVLLPLIVVLVVMLGCVVFSWAQFGWPEEALIYSDGRDILVWKKMLLYAWPTHMLMHFVFALGEEIGWRGYLLNRLRTSPLGFYGRALFVALVWGCWHLPAYFQMNLPLFSMFLFLVVVCLISILFTWLYERHNAIWPCVFMHASHNFLINEVLPQYTLVQTGPDWLYTENGLLVMVGYALLVCIYVFYRKRIYK